MVNPLKGGDVNWLQVTVQFWPTFLISDIRTLALSYQRQSAQMSEIENVVWTWMALNTFKCNYLTPLHFKGLVLMDADKQIVLVDK